MLAVRSDARSSIGSDAPSPCLFAWVEASWMLASPPLAVPLKKIWDPEVPSRLPLAPTWPATASFGLPTWLRAGSHNGIHFVPPPECACFTLCCTA